MAILKRITLLSVLLLINNQTTGMELNKTTVYIRAVLGCAFAVGIYLHKNPSLLNDAKIFFAYMNGDNLPLVHALYLAVETPNLSRCKYLLKDISDISHLQLTDTCSLVDYACTRNTLDFIKFLVSEKGVKLSPKHIHQGLTKAYIEAENNNTQDLSNFEYWIDQVIDVEKIDLNKLLITICSRKDELNIVKKLVQKGADINYRYKKPVAWLEPKTPLGIAIQSNNVVVVKFLLSQKVKINPIYVACAAGNRDMNFFVEQYANLQDSLGQTALHYPGVITKRYAYSTIYSTRGDKDKIHHLLISGADPEIKDNNGLTACDKTYSKEEGEILKDRMSVREKVIIPHIQQHIHKPGDGNLNITTALKNREYGNSFTRRIAY